MEDYENMVDENDEFDQEDLPEGIVEDEESDEESVDDFVEEEVLGEEEDEPEEDEEEPDKGRPTEPGYVKGRIEKAVQKAKSEMLAQFEQIKAEMRADFAKQLAPYQEKLLESEANDLVRSGEFKSLERAKEYLKLKQGQSVEEEKPEQPRSEDGRFAPKEDPVTKTKIDMLAKQADKIKAKTGIDVIDIMSNDEEIKQKVFTGEMDFYDVAEQYGKKTRRKPPAPMRSSNGASGVTPNVFENMTSEQFERFERNIDKGVRYKLK